MIPRPKLMAAPVTTSQAPNRSAAAFVRDRLAPATPANDGRQTPMRGHPVFIAQHATATCCRTCLQINHGIAKGHELSPRERAYVVDVICRWIEIEAEHGSSLNR